MPKHHSQGLTPAGRVLCWAVHEPPASAGASIAVGRAVKCLGSTGHVKASGLYLWISPAFNFQGVLFKSQHMAWLAASSPGFSSIWFPSLHPLLPSSPLPVTVTSQSCPFVHLGFAADKSPLLLLER